MEINNKTPLFFLYVSLIIVVAWHILNVVFVIILVSLYFHFLIWSIFLLPKIYFKGLERTLISVFSYIVDMEDLKQFAKSQGASEADDLTHWDTAFWSERLRESKFEINEVLFFSELCLQILELSLLPFYIPYHTTNDRHICIIQQICFFLFLHINVFMRFLDIAGRTATLLFIAESHGWSFQPSEDAVWH